METKIPTLEDLRKIPTDEVVLAKITKVELKTWLELIKDPETLAKFKTPEQLMVVIEYTYDGFIRTDKFSFAEKPTTTSALGKFMLKHSKFPEIGMDIKVDFDKDGKSKIRL